MGWTQIIFKWYIYMQKKKRKKKTHGLSLPPVTIKPSLSVVYIVKTGPLWALATIRINTWSFQTQTSPLIVPVNVKLFWKGEKYTHHLILSKVGRKTFRNKHHLHLEDKLLLFAPAEEETVEEAIRTSRDGTMGYYIPSWTLKDAFL